MDNISVKYLESAVSVYCIVYKLAGQNMPYIDLPVDMELQELNCPYMGRVLHSIFRCPYCKKKKKKTIAKN